MNKYQNQGFKCNSDLSAYINALGEQPLHDHTVFCHSPDPD